MKKLEYVYNDGGRSLYFKATNVADCTIRAAAIAKGADYKEVYNSAKKFLGYSPRDGVAHNDTKKLMSHLGFKWVPTMTIGSGCKVHLCDGEVPMQGAIVCQLSGHVTAVVDGVINDTYDPSREGTRCVYGYWTL